MSSERWWWCREHNMTFTSIYDPTWCRTPRKVDPFWGPDECIPLIEEVEPPVPVYGGPR